MKVLLNQDIAALGLIGEVVEVKPGYARNYLLPLGLACEPTPTNVKKIEAERVRVEAERIKRRQSLEAMASRLAGKEITLVRMSNELGHLYGAVGGRDIAEALAAEGFTVEPAEVLIHEPIRTLDKYELEIRLAADISATITVWVVPEKGTILAPETQARLSGETAAEPDGGDAEAPDEEA